VSECWKNVAGRVGRGAERVGACGVCAWKRVWCVRGSSVGESLCVWKGVQACVEGCARSVWKPGSTCVRRLAEMGGERGDGGVWMRKREREWEREQEKSG